MWQAGSSKSHVARVPLVKAYGSTYFYSGVCVRSRPDVSLISVCMKVSRPGND